MTDSFLEVDDGKIRYQTIGDRDDKPFLLLNGVFMSLDRWEPISSDLSDDYFIVLHDMRCQGGSLCPDEVSLMDHVNDVVAIMDELEIEKANIAGTSYGGEIAQLIAMEYPERVEDLSLISTTSEISTDMYYMALRWRMGADSSDARKFVLSWINDVYSGGFLRDNPGILDMLVDRLEKTDFNFDGAVKLLDAFMELKENPITPDLHKIDVPVQVISASEDRVKPPEFGKKIQNEIKNSDYTEIEGSGHAVVIEKPDRLLNVLREFLESD